MEQILKDEIAVRRRNCLAQAADRGLDALLVVGKGPERCGDMVYLANHRPLLPGHPRRYTFKGRGFSLLLLPLDQEPVLTVTTPFYEDDIAVEDIRFGNNLPAVTAKAIGEKGLGRADIGLVGTDVLPLAVYRDLVRELPGVNFSAADDIVMNLRAVKSGYELALLRKGAAIADEVCREVKAFIAPGKRESQVGDLIVDLLRSRGVSLAFATCQSGERSKEPYDHVPVSDKVIQDGDMIHMEINGRYQGYMIDICRSTVAGQASQEQRRLLELTLLMLEQTVAATRAGIRAEDLERISGRIALDNGLGPNHTAAYGGPGTYLGHAIGLGVDEPPCLAEGDKTLLKAGMVLTLEPGLYRTPFGGCRIEDEVLVKEDGAEVLNRDDRKWWD